ncbi:MAG: sulfatase/phosphatase domain-containing protein [Puniceicoccaceae bacterium]
MKDGDQPFFLCVSFDEPHGPFMTPLKYLEEAEQSGFEMRPNVNASLEGKPERHKWLAEGHENSEEDFHPIRRVLVNDRYKLVINLFDRDELYDHQTDPYEMTNRIDDEEYQEVRDEMHRELLAEMWRTRDTLRCEQWIHRDWRGTQDET